MIFGLLFHQERTELKRHQLEVRLRWQQIVRISHSLCIRYLPLLELELKLTYLYTLRGNYEFGRGDYLYDKVPVERD